jgi:hypothetical protein
VFALFALLAAVPADAAAAASPADQIAALNAQRAAHGIPAGIVEIPAWSEGCRRHMEYIAANGGVPTHEEISDHAGYSSDGAEIGRRAVITPLPEAFTPAANAFESAPLHLMQTLAPALSRMGVWGGCATTNLGYDRAAGSPAVFTYPGNGVTGFYVSEVAYELPKTPGDFVGLPQGTTTGPHILVMTLGTKPGRIASATLTGPAGPLDIRTVDNETGGLEGYMPPGGMIIPVAALAQATTYTASATFQPHGGGVKDALTSTWSFTTVRPAPPVAPAASPPAVVASQPPPAVATSLQLSHPRAAGRGVRFTLRADPRLVGQRAVVTIYRVARSCAGGTCRDRQKGRKLMSAIRRLAARQSLTAPRPTKGRAIVVLVQTKPFQRAGIGFAASQAVARWAGT